MHDEFASEGTEECMIVTNWTIEMLPRQGVRFQPLLFQNIEGHVRLGNQKIPHIFGKSSAMPTIIDKKCALNVKMVRSDALW